MSHAKLYHGDTRLDFAKLALNKHLSDKDIENLADSWRFKYENTDAYSQSRNYLEKEKNLRNILRLRKEYGVEINGRD